MCTSSSPAAGSVACTLTSCPGTRQVIGVISRHRPATTAAMAAELGVDYNALVPVLDDLVKSRELRTEADTGGIAWVAA